VLSGPLFSAGAKVHIYGILLPWHDALDIKFLYMRNVRLKVCMQWFPPTICLAYFNIIDSANIIVLKNGVFWDVTPCGSCKNRRFGGT
jgi:hypothetical protein